MKDQVVMKSKEKKAKGIILDAKITKQDQAIDEDVRKETKTKKHASSKIVSELFEQKEIATAQLVAKKEKCSKISTDLEGKSRKGKKIKIEVAGTDTIKLKKFKSKPSESGDESHVEHVIESSVEKAVAKLKEKHKRTKSKHDEHFEGDIETPQTAAIKEKHSKKSSALEGKSGKDKKRKLEDAETDTVTLKKSKPSDESHHVDYVHDVKEGSVEKMVAKLKEKPKRSKLKHVKHIESNIKTSHDANESSSKIVDNGMTKLKENEKSKRERKLKKSQNKNRKLLVAGTSGEEETVPGDGKSQVESLKYLNRWKSDSEHWSFQKVRQVWLLQNMYDVDKASNSLLDSLLYK